MITGFVYKGGRNVWIDPEEDPKQVYSTDPNIRKRLPDDWGNIIDLFVDNHILKVRTDKGVFNIHE